MTKLWTTMIGLVGVASLAAGARGEAPEKVPLYSVINSCWEAVEENRLDALLVPEMAFERSENEGQQSEYAVWLGTAQTEFGEIDIRASMRGAILFDCTMHSLPPRKDADLIEFDEAQKVLAMWFADRMKRPGYFDTFPDIRYFGLARCVSDELTMTAAATSFGLVPADVILKGSDEKIAGELLVNIIRTNPKNFEHCTGIGAL